MSKVIVTSGSKFLDIDGYASIIAYTKFLQSKGVDAIAFSTAPFNASIPKELQEEDLSRKFLFSGDEKFIILDISNPNYFEKFVKEENIIEVIDHHFGYEDYWKNKNQTNVNIEKIGAVATLIFEKFVKENRQNILNTKMCKLLAAAILDNTLNFQADITTNRDKITFQTLLKLGALPSDFSDKYFLLCQNEVKNNFQDLIMKDIKEENLSNLPKIIGQIIFYDIDELMLNKDKIIKVFSEYDDWFLNILSFKTNTSILWTTKKQSKIKLEILFNKKFEGDLLFLDKLIIIKLALEVNGGK